MEATSTVIYMKAKVNAFLEQDFIYGDVTQSKYLYENQGLY